jgi:hypothetical protein
VVYVKIEIVRRGILKIFHLIARLMKRMNRKKLRSYIWKRKITRYPIILLWLKVKDRVLAHNPIAALYLSEGYYESKLIRNLK